MVLFLINSCIRISFYGGMQLFRSMCQINITLYFGLVASNCFISEPLKISTKVDIHIAALVIIFSYVEKIMSHFTMYHPVTFYHVSPFNVLFCNTLQRFIL